LKKLVDFFLKKNTLINSCPFENWAKENNLKDKNPSLYKLYCKLYRLEHVTVSSIDEIHQYTKIPNLTKLLPRNIISYDSLVELRNDIYNTYSFLEKIKESPYKKVFNQLNHSQKIDFINSVKVLFPAYISEIESLCESKGISYKNPNDVIKTKLLESLSKNRDKASIIYHKDNLLIIKVFNHQGSEIFGSKKWCLKNEENWNGYVNKDNQFFVYNFDLHHEYDGHLLGFTIKLDTCHKCLYHNKFKLKYLFNQENDNLWDFDDKFSKKNVKFKYKSDYYWKMFKRIKKTLFEVHYQLNMEATTTN
jgi:hypothetical protein